MRQSIYINDLEEQIKEICKIESIRYPAAYPGGLLQFLADNSYTKPINEDYSCGKKPEES